MNLPHCTILSVYTDNSCKDSVKIFAWVLKLKRKIIILYVIICLWCFNIYLKAPGFPCYTVPLSKDLLGLLPINSLIFPSLWKGVPFFFKITSVHVCACLCWDRFLLCSLGSLQTYVSLHQPPHCDWHHHIMPIVLLSWLFTLIKQYELAYVCFLEFWE